jgi:hypothetical protein
VAIELDRCSATDPWRHAYRRRSSPLNDGCRTIPIICADEDGRPNFSALLVAEPFANNFLSDSSGRLSDDGGHFGYPFHSGDFRL